MPRKKSTLTERAISFRIFVRTFAYTTSSEQLKDGLRYDKKSYSVARNRPLRLDDSIGPAGCREVQPVLLDDHDDQRRRRGRPEQTLDPRRHVQPQPVDHRRRQQDPALVRPPRIPLLGNRKIHAPVLRRAPDGRRLRGGRLPYPDHRRPLPDAPQDQLLHRIVRGRRREQASASVTSFTSAPTGTSKSRAARVWHASSTTGSRPTPPCAKRATRTPCATCPFPPRSASRSSICSTPRNNAT